MTTTCDPLFLTETLGCAACLHAPLACTRCSLHAAPRARTRHAHLNAWLSSQRRMMRAPVYNHAKSASGTKLRLQNYYVSWGHIHNPGTCRSMLSPPPRACSPATSRSPPRTALRTSCSRALLSWLVPPLVQSLCCVHHPLHGCWRPSQLQSRCVAWTRGTRALALRTAFPPTHTAWAYAVAKMRPPLGCA
jgi:hypothetical protein